ncbi:MAG: calcium/sodium antiporter [Gammaproteobacteria bacterium]|nr:calcium/sodium antiporter [Gammaproteobacteria bacterium]
MLAFIAAVVIGLALLVWSADRFVEGASVVAKNLGVSTLIIGITVIGFGTSAPEILISIFSVLDDTPDLAIGNALGSNIANIGLILGATALLIPLTFSSKLVKREFPILLAATALMSWVLWDNQLNLLDGILLLGFLILALGYLIRFSKTNKDDPISSELEQEIPQNMSTQRAFMLTLVGLLILVGSSKLLVWGAVNIATELGVSELIIGLTIVALGTSLPELAAAIAGARKGEPELVMGNVIGSNLFNSLAVIGLPAVMMDFTISPTAIARDLPVMLALTALLYLLSQLPKSSYCVITRFKGLLLLSGFVLYQAFLYYQVIAR